MMRRVGLLGVLVAVAACGGGVSPGLDAGFDAGGPTYRLSGLPDCGAPGDGGTAGELYDTVLIRNGCAASGCHAPPNATLFELDGGATFREVTVGRPSSQVPELNLVTAGDVHSSYLVYKIVGQHLDAGFIGVGDRMPQGGPYLDEADTCRVLNWVTYGAR